MIVEEALHVGELKRGDVIAGRNGLQRKVSYVEVMEVPEVSDWITPGILVMTTFYSIKDEPDKQIKVVKDLIANKAAGMVIKLGRFVMELPDEVIELANKNDFPIIRIPVDISYIEILTPLHEKLLNKKREKQDVLLNPLLGIDHSNLISFPETLNKIKDIVKCHVYIEDLEGRLLYVSDDFRPDGWRRKKTIFSLPEYSSYEEIIHSWERDFSEKGFSEMKIPGYRNRLLLPLTSQNRVFAILHIPYTNNIQFESSDSISKLSYKFSELFMSDQLYLQRKRIDDMELMDRLLQKTESVHSNKVASIVYFDAGWLTNVADSSSYLIDYTSIIRGKIYNIIDSVSGWRKVVFERNSQFYALLYGDEEAYPHMIQQLSETIKNYNEKEKNNRIRVAVSPYMKTPTSFEDRLKTVQKTMEFGVKMKPGESVYTYDQLGIYEVLFRLTKDKPSAAYARNILAPLENGKEELLETLEVYLNENGNVSRSAEILYVHRRTLTYRIQKIEELLNMDLNNSMHRFILQFCLLLRELS